MPLAPETKAATEFATAADLQQAKIHSRSESETLGMLGLILSKRRLGHTTDPRYVNRYHGPDDMARNKANGLAEWEGKGNNRDSTAVATDRQGNLQGSKDKNQLRATRMTRDKAKKVGLPSNRQGGSYTLEEIDLWEEVFENEGEKQHISAHANTETGRVRVVERDQRGNVIAVLDDFKVENFNSVKQSI